MFHYWQLPNTRCITDTALNDYHVNVALCPNKENAGLYKALLSLLSKLLSI